MQALFSQTMNAGLIFTNRYHITMSTCHVPNPFLRAIFRTRLSGVFCSKYDICKSNLRLNTHVHPQTQYPCVTSDSIPMCKLRLNTHVQLLIDEYNAVSSHYISSRLVLRLIFNNLWLLKRILLKQRP